MTILRIKDSCSRKAEIEARITKELEGNETVFPQGTVMRTIQSSRSIFRKIVSAIFGAKAEYLYIEFPSEESVSDSEVQICLRIQDWLIQNFPQVEVRRHIPKKKRDFE